MRKVGVLVLAVPGCLVVAWLTAGLVLAPFARHPLWLDAGLNLSEAAAARDVGEIVRLIENSADPNAAYELRPGFVAEDVARLTPLEAAVASKDAETARILLVNGAVMGAETWNRLRCSAEGDEMTRFLDQHRPDGAVLQCDIGPRPSATTR
jgi:hypothetical protein